MSGSARDDAVRDLLSAVIGLVSNWTAISTQGSIAREVGVNIAAGDVRALYTLGLRGGVVRPAALADELALSRPTTSKVIARLESAGLATRDRRGSDGRSVDIALTSAGHAAYSRLVGAGARMVDQAMTDMSAAEIDVITAASKRLAGELRE